MAHLSFPFHKPASRSTTVPTDCVALADGPKFFEELMTAVGSRDGREVVRTLGGLRDKLSLDRDGEGRYFIKAGPAGSK